MKDRNKITKVPEHLNNTPLLPEDMLPRIGRATFKIELDKEWFREPDILTEKLTVVSEPKAPWYQRLLNKITFGLYKPTKWSYEVKMNDKEYTPIENF